VFDCIVVVAFICFGVGRCFVERADEVSVHVLAVSQFALECERKDVCKRLFVCLFVCK
jgi:hypothetical protein